MFYCLLEENNCLLKKSYFQHSLSFLSVIFFVFVIADKKIDNQRQNEIQPQSNNSIFLLFV